jgi:hypothetical protein
MVRDPDPHLAAGYAPVVSGLRSGDALGLGVLEERGVAGQPGGLLGHGVGLVAGVGLMS